MATIYDVAKAAGVSPKTVSRVLNGDAPVNPQTREIVEAAMRSLNYVPSSAARSMRSNKTGLVGMITGARQAEAIIAEGKADLVALARGVMDDPRWAWHAARELGAETAYSPMYARCKPGVWRPAHEE